MYRFAILALISVSLSAQEKKITSELEQTIFSPSVRPDRIMLTWEGDPATTQTVTWRTDTTVTKPIAELIMADASPYLDDHEKEYRAETVHVGIPESTAAYHKFTFTHLLPNSIYAYRLGNGKYWSEWYQFKTAPLDKTEPFSFIYLGDAQNRIFDLWSRVVRAAYSDEPKARFILHVGDLINNAESDYEWGEWFAAGGFIYGMIPTVAVPGNHEYIKNEKGLKLKLSALWQPQFNFPANGPDRMQDQCYYFDYQNLRVIALNSNENWEAQAAWMEDKLKNNPNQWTIVTLHHPVFKAAAKDREAEEVTAYWKPLFEKYKVDMVLQGHDHTYARGTDPNLKDSGPVYVVSVSGAKMYEIAPGSTWMKRAAENTQLYQIITVDQKKLTFRATTVAGELYDSFELYKNGGKQNRIREIKPYQAAERRFSNTLKKK
jgi:acid phosphatase type 7